MIYNIIIILIGITLELILNLYLNINSYFIPLFTILSLVFVFPYFKNSKKDFLIFSSLVGFIYDLIFTNFYVLNAFLFGFISIIIYYIFKKINFNLLNIILITFIIIITYNILLFIIFNIFDYANYNFNELIFIIKHFFIINIIYIIINYFISYKFYLKNII